MDEFLSDISKIFPPKFDMNQEELIKQLDLIISNSLSPYYIIEILKSINQENDVNQHFIFCRIAVKRILSLFIEGRELEEILSVYDENTLIYFMKNIPFFFVHSLQFEYEFLNAYCDLFHYYNTDKTLFCEINSTITKGVSDNEVYNIFASLKTITLKVLYIIDQNDSYEFLSHIFMLFQIVGKRFLTSELLINSLSLFYRAFFPLFCFFPEFFNNNCFILDFSAELCSNLSKYVLNGITLQIKNLYSSILSFLKRTVEICERDSLDEKRDYIYQKNIKPILDILLGYQDWVIVSINDEKISSKYIYIINTLIKSNYISLNDHKIPSFLRIAISCCYLIDEDKLIYSLNPSEYYSLAIKRTDENSPAPRDIGICFFLTLYSNLPTETFKALELNDVEEYIVEAKMRIIAEISLVTENDDTKVAIISLIKTTDISNLPLNIYCVLCLIICNSIHFLDNQMKDEAFNLCVNMIQTNNLLLFLIGSDILNNLIINRFRVNVEVIILLMKCCFFYESINSQIVVLSFIKYNLISFEAYIDEYIQKLCEYIDENILEEKDSSTLVNYLSIISDIFMVGYKFINVDVLLDFMVQFLNSSRYNEMKAIFHIYYVIAQHFESANTRVFIQIYIMVKEENELLLIFTKEIFTYLTISLRFNKDSLVTLFQSYSPEIFVEFAMHFLYNPYEYMNDTLAIGKFIIQMFIVNCISKEEFINVTNYVLEIIYKAKSNQEMNRLVSPNYQCYIEIIITALVNNIIRIDITSIIDEISNVLLSKNIDNETKDTLVKHLSILMQNNTSDVSANITRILNQVENSSIEQ